MDPSGGEGNIDDVERSPASPPAASPIDRLEADLISPDEPLSLLKIVVVGDEGCGKTALCQALTGQRFDAKQLHGPTISETKYRHTFTLLNLLEGDTPTAADIVDTAGSEDLDRLRPFAYDGVHMWLVCFAVDDIQSLVSVFERWVPEVKYYHPEIPLILVGCKADLRSGEPNGDPDGSSARAVSTAAGRAVARKIDAHKYIETSAKAGLHISDFFDDGVHD
ncbi:P-loop containing nucleoside triphosphate hydrolase protein, partial [Zopfochytrium polystomum]